jgi:outer membrane protein OmpA-like peptidoglycan-associated protein
MGFDSKAFSLFAAALTMAAPAFAEEVKTEAVIISHAHGQLTARTRQGPVKIVMMPTTTIKQSKGLSKRTMDAKSLIPGLIIKVQGDQQGDTITASRVDFSDRDWRTAVATKAGTTAEFAELRKAIIEGHEYVIQKEVSVYFPTGKATIAPEYMAQLRTVAQQAPSFGNYRVSILGFADTRGNTAANERLSLKRAAAVSNFMRQTGHIQPGRVLSPSAMGEGTVAPGETAPGTDAEARRVVVRIVTPKTQLQH